MARNKVTKGHGGPREGAGRPEGRFVDTKKKPATKVMRVPLALVTKIRKMIADYLKRNP